MIKFNSRLIKLNPRLIGIIGAGVLSIAGVTINHFEGQKNTAYLDPVGIPTVCAGVTKGVKLGDHYTSEQCDKKTEQALTEHLAGLERCIKGYLTPNQWAAVTSWGYNVGVGAACSSTLVRLINQGAPATQWCNQLPRWVYSHGRKLKGLVRRREAEKQLCLADSNTLKQGGEEVSRLVHTQKVAGSIPAPATN